MSAIPGVGSGNLVVDQSSTLDKTGGVSTGTSTTKTIAPSNEGGTGVVSNRPTSGADERRLEKLLTQENRSGSGILRTSLESKLETTAPEVTALLHQYGVFRPAGRPRDRILKWAAVLQKALSAERDPEKLADHLLSIDIRRQVFLLEGILKLYAKRYGGHLEKRLANVKELEDALGCYSDAKKLASLALDSLAAPDAVAELAKAAVKAHEELVELISERWLPDPSNHNRAKGMSKLIDHLMEVDWDKPKADREFLQHELSRRIAKIEESDYDMTDLQDGLHELRRQLRWLPIYAEALDGLVVLDDKQNPVSKYAPLLCDPIATSKFVVLPPPDREEKPILLPKSLYVAVMKLVLDLGALKDEGEHIELIADAYVEGGAQDSHKKARHEVAELLGKPRHALKEVFEKAEELYAELSGGRLLPALREAIKAG